jgi:hypothetical protein
VVSFTPQPLYRQGKSPCHSLDRRLGGSQSRSGRGGEEESYQLLPGLENPIIQPVAQSYTTELYKFQMNRNTSVSVVTVYRIVDRVSISRRGRNFIFRHRVQTGSGALTACYPADCPLPFIAMIKKAWIHTSASSNAKVSFGCLLHVQRYDLSFLGVIDCLNVLLLLPSGQHDSSSLLYV